jgi:putative sporulation protein YyaC
MYHVGQAGKMRGDDVSKVIVPDTPLKISHTDPTAVVQLSSRLKQWVSPAESSRQIVVVCLGTDRSTGDALGPLTGSALRKHQSPRFELFGTLEEPVHAVNLQETLENIQTRFRDPFVIGIDACLGSASSVGHVIAAPGPVKPGAGVHKKLPPVGDIHISGIVNIGGFMEYFVLQNTRLHLVMRMAELIAESLYLALHRE